MLGAYNSEKEECLEHTIRFPGAYNSVLEHTILFPGAYNSVYFFWKHEKYGPPSGLIAPTPKTRACIVTASLRHCLCPPPAHEYQYAGRGNFLPLRLVAARPCVGEVGRAPNTAQKFHHWISPRKSAEDPLPKQLPRIPPRVSPTRSPEGILLGFPSSAPRDFPVRKSFENTSREKSFAYSPRMFPEDFS